MDTSLDLDVDFNEEVRNALVRLHDWSVENPRESEAAFVGTTVFAWYAMPDLLRGTGMRFIGKSALLASVVAYYRHLGVTKEDVAKVGDDLKMKWRDKLGHIDPKLQIGIGVAGVAALLALNSAEERYILHRGERRERAGKRFAHVRQGLFLGGLAGGVTYWALKTDR